MKRTWLAIALVLCGLAQGLIGVPVARAEDDITGAQLLPADTLLYLSLPDVPEYKDAFDKSLTGAMLRDPELKPFLDDVKKKIDELSDKLQQEVGVTIPELLAVPNGEVTFALMERPVRKMAPVLIVDYGDYKETVDKLLKKLHDGLDGDIAEHSTQEIKDVTVHVYKFKDEDPNNPFKSLVYFNDESYLVFSTELAAAKEVLNRWDGTNTDTLANSEVYKYIQEQCRDEAGDPQFVWYVSPIRVIQATLSVAQSVAPQAGMAAAFIPTLGFDRLKGFGGAGYFSTGDFDTVSKTFLYAEQPTGVLKVFQFPATDLTPPKWVPADATAYFSANWDVAQAYLAVESLIDGFQPRGTTAKQLDRLAESGIGIHIKKDILDLLDGRFQMIQSADAGGDLESERFLFAFDLKDAAQMKKTLAKIAKSESERLETREFNGETIYEIGAGEQTLSVTIASGQFIFTNDTPALEAMLRSEKPAPLVESAAYRKISKYFPAKASILSYSNSDSQMKALYDLMKDADTPEFLEGIDLEKLPSFEVLQKYLRPSGFYTVPDKKGAKSVGFQLRESDK